MGCKNILVTFSNFNSNFIVQFDYGGWLPNSPNSMRKPPPTTKGCSTEQTLLDTLPDIATTVNGAMFRWMLSANSADWVSSSIIRAFHFRKLLTVT